MTTKDNISNDTPTIGMLLDIEHLYGEHEGRLSPILTSLLLALAPALFYVYFGWFELIPVWLFAPINAIIAARVVMIIPGRENYRLANYRKRLYDDYTSAASLMRIKTIYPDGFVEYVNGKCFYAVKCYNGTCENIIQRSQMLRKFLLSMAGDYEFDVYILNENNTSAIRRYYKTVNRFGKNTASMNFTKIIDMLSTKTRDKSMVQCTVFVVKGSRSDWKQIRIQIDGAINSQMAKAFKRVYRVTSLDELHDIIDRDIDTSVNIDDLLRAKYKTGEYYTSRVVAYDPVDEVVIGKDPMGQPTEPVVVEKKRSSFHVAYSEDTVSESVLKRAKPKPDYYDKVVVGGVSSEEKRSNGKTAGNDNREDQEERSTGKASVKRGSSEVRRRKVRNR